jgi:hypothetical protein
MNPAPTAAAATKAPVAVSTVKWASPPNVETSP